MTPNNCRKVLVLLTILVCLPLIAASDRKEPPFPMEDAGAKAEIVIRDVPYVPSMPDNPLLMLDVYSNPHEGLLPAIIYIHGGGWMEGDKGPGNNFSCKYLANHGYVVFNINYRLLPETPIKNQVEDAMAAVIWVKEHAKEYGGDPGRVGVAGGSAGAHISALIAWASDDPYFTPTGNPDNGLDSDVKAAALFVPPINFDETLKANGTIFLLPLARLIFTKKVGGPYKKLVKHISPHNHIDEDCVPTIFFAGEEDELKLYPQSVEYHQELKELGIDTELFIAYGHGHGWPWWSADGRESAELMTEFFDRYLK